jgi:hypothetical protein
MKDQSHENVIVFLYAYLLPSICLSAAFAHKRRFEAPNFGPIAVP